MKIIVTSGDHIIRLNHYYLSFKQNTDYNCTFIKDTNIPESVLKKIFGDVRQTKYSKYLPYLIREITVCSEGIMVYGKGSFTIHKNMITFNKK